MVCGPGSQPLCPDNLTADLLCSRPGYGFIQTQPNGVYGDGLLCDTIFEERALSIINIRHEVGLPIVRVKTHE